MQAEQTQVLHLAVTSTTESPHLSQQENSAGLADKGCWPPLAVSPCVSAQMP